MSRYAPLLFSDVFCHLTPASSHFVVLENKVTKQLAKVQQEFSDELWASISDILAAILKHSFLVKLVDGSLGIEQFKTYIVQDALFLGDFAKSLELLSSKVNNKELREKIKEHSQTMLQAETLLHNFFFSTWGHEDQSDVSSARKNPTNMAYTNYLLASTSLLPFHEGLASVLPCYWIYLKVGTELQRSGSPNPVYQRWIETYSSAEYEESVSYILDAMNQVAKTLDEDQKRKCRTHFRLGSTYEYLFWDAAYNLEVWRFE